MALPRVGIHAVKEEDGKSRVVRVLYLGDKLQSSRMNLRGMVK